MDTQTRPQGGFTSNLWLQFAALVIVVGVVLVVARLPGSFATVAALRRLGQRQLAL